MRKYWCHFFHIHGNITDRYARIECFGVTMKLSAKLHNVFGYFSKYSFVRLISVQVLQVIEQGSKNGFSFSTVGRKIYDIFCF